MPIDALDVMDLWRSLVEDVPTPSSTPRSDPSDGLTLFVVPVSMTPTTCTPMTEVYPPGRHLLDSSASTVGATVVDGLTAFLDEHGASLARTDDVRRADEFVYPVV